MINKSLLSQLEKFCNQDKVLIVVTGITGSGKTTIVRELKASVKSTKPIIFFEVDKYKVEEYVACGFRNNIEKIILRNKAVNSVKADIIKNARIGINIVIEYAMSNAEWGKFFNHLHTEYGYKVIVVNCNIRNIEEIIASKEKRKSESLLGSGRHKSLSCSRYINEDDYYIAEEVSDDKIRERYRTNYYTSIQGQVVINSEGVIYF